MPERPPSVAADHAEDFGRRYARELDAYCALRMEELGVPERLHGATDFDGDGQWKAFIDRERQGGNLTDGISINSGCLNPELLSGKGGRVWERARLSDRIDAIIAHEFEEDLTGAHDRALKAAPRRDCQSAKGQGGF